VLGVVLIGFALGWATLAFLSQRSTDQPQRWAMVPAVFMGVSGLLLLVLGSTLDSVLDWVWPPALLVLAIWMARRIHRELPSRAGRWLLYPVVALMVLVSVAGGYETVQAATDDDYPRPGRLVDVGDHQLHLRCTGSGSPTVVLEAGGGGMSSEFGWIAPAVSEQTRVCVYDRASHGWSDPTTAGRNGAQTATDLHTLLERGDVPGPYVLAGHSFGGLYTLAYAALFPDDVVGMVLVDTTAPAAEPAARDASAGDAPSEDVLDRVAALVGTSARLGVGRLLGASDYGALPPRARDEMRAATATEAHARGTADDYIRAGAATGQAAWLQDFDYKPLVVLTAGVGTDADWVARHGELAALSDNSTQRVIDGADHSGLLHDEDAAGQTTQAIIDVVASVRQGQPLPE
jgi:pimeloyl-ACP methyl ester carboxylesterase